MHICCGWLFLKTLEEFMQANNYAELHYMKKRETIVAENCNNWPEISEQQSKNTLFLE